MKRVLVINGPNLNMLGRREPEIYGSATLADVEALCRRKTEEHGFGLDFRQSNSESDLIGWIQTAEPEFSAVVINAAAYTHTSVAIHDALKTLRIPIIEVHISNPMARDEFRHVSYVAPLASAIIAGCGIQGYGFAIDRLSTVLRP